MQISSLDTVPGHELTFPQYFVLLISIYTFVVVQLSEHYNDYS